MKIEVTVNPQRHWKLFIDGKQPMYIGCTSKDSVKRYLKKHYNINLLIDKNIIRNYIEYT